MRAEVRQPKVRPVGQDRLQLNGWGKQLQLKLIVYASRDFELSSANSILHQYQKLEFSVHRSRMFIVFPECAQEPQPSSAVDDFQSHYQRLSINQHKGGGPLEETGVRFVPPSTDATQLAASP